MSGFTEKEREPKKIKMSRMTTRVTTAVPYSKYRASTASPGYKCRVADRYDTRHL